MNMSMSINIIPSGEESAVVWNVSMGAEQHGTRQMRAMRAMTRRKMTQSGSPFVVEYNTLCELRESKQITYCCVRTCKLSFLSRWQSVTVFGSNHAKGSNAWPGPQQR